MSSAIDWYRKLWRDATPPDSEARIGEREHKLGIELPSLLRAFLASTSMRDGEMLHVQKLDNLSLSSIGGLVFAREQQATGFWAIPMDRLTMPDPLLVYGDGDSWSEDGCTLEEFLR